MTKEEWLLSHQEVQLVLGNQEKHTKTDKYKKYTQRQYKIQKNSGGGDICKKTHRFLFCTLKGGYTASGTVTAVFKASCDIYKLRFFQL